MSLSQQDLCRADFYTWLKTRWVLPSGEPYSFKDHEYLEQIAKHPWKRGDQVFVEKPAQVGVSELGIAYTLWQNDRDLPGYSGVGYFFPARAQLQDHVKARFFPAFDHDLPQSRYLRSKLGNANLRFVNFNKKPIYFRSGQTRRELISIALDAAVIDEFDEFENPISVVPTLEMRFMHSKYGYLLGMSTPTIPDTGIDQAFSLSNQYNWYVKCQKCHKEFSPLAEVKIVGIENTVVRAPLTGHVGFVCPYCHDLTQTNGVPGRWHLDQQKDNQKYAYGVSRLFTENHSLKKILADYEDALNIQEFYNSVLGIAYAAANARLTRSSISELCNGPEKHFGQSEEHTWMGVDVGKKCHWVVGKPTPTGQKQIIAYGFCSFDELKSVVARYSVKYCVIDLRPYEQEVKKFIGGNKSFMACDFNSGNQEDWYRLTKVDSETSDKSLRVIKADKTQCCDILIREIMGKKSFVLPGNTKADTMFMNQMCAPVRVDKTDKDTGDIKAVYGNGGRADHYFFAMVYFLLACQLKRGVTVRLGSLFA
jgi:hypothetical protein